MMTDPVGDMLTRIRNAGRAKHSELRCASSKLKRAVARVLSEEGFLGEVRVVSEGEHPVLVMDIRYAESGAIRSNVEILQYLHQVSASLRQAPQRT